MQHRRPPTLPIATLICFAALAAGCASGRTVLIADDSPVRIGPGVTGRVYQLLEGKWVLSDAPAALPEGWYVVPTRFVEGDGR